MRFTNKDITIEISERLQTQITWLCTNVNDIEWSGTLFYRVKSGSLDEPNCVIVAEYVYLQDIGTTGYTEYTFKPEYTSFLMSHPELMEMHSGHIHSHHNMAVFFSGTDDDELVVNSEFHNYYLSLIVNNRNEMTAKVAFRYTKTMNINSVMKYRNTNGQFVTADIQPESKEIQVAGFYDCFIVKPEGAIDQELIDRFKVVEEENKSKKLLQTNSFQNYGRTGTNLNSNYGKKDENWSYQAGYGWTPGSQPNLFDDVKDQRTSGRRVKKDHKQNQNHKSNVKTFSKEIGRIDAKLSSFLSKLIALDHLNEDSLTITMRNVNQKINTAHARLIYGESLSDRLEEFYLGTYPEDPHFQMIETRVISGIEFIMDIYKSTYPLLVDEIIDSVLETQIK